MPPLEQIFFKIEALKLGRYLRWSLALLAVLFLFLAYDLDCFKNMSSPEAMDTAQLARQIASGKGYTTRFVRPFSIFLVKRANEARFGPLPAGQARDDARLKTEHPDIANAPVYPVVLAGLMKVLRFDYEASTTKQFWSSSGHFERYQPDFLISVFNQFLFLAAVVCAFFLAHRLFDESVAWMSAALLFGTEIFWRFTISGLSTMLLLLIFLALAWCLVLLEAEAREPKRGTGWLFGLAATAGLIAGLAGLTRYSFAWMIIPTIGFILIVSGPKRTSLAFVTLAVFALVMGPWLVRNKHVSGTPFGTTTYSVLEGTDRFPADRLERSLQPDFTIMSSLRPIWTKLTQNGRQIVTGDLPRLAGIWLTPLFFAGLLVGFRNPAIRRLRYFLLMSLAVFIPVQALDRTWLSDETPEINTENLLVLLAPLVIMFATSFFVLLLDQIQFAARQMRIGIMALAGVVICSPLIFALLPPWPLPVNYPPYHPLMIQQGSALLDNSELMMSDIPWAVAWYGNRQCVWITLNATPDPNDTESIENFFDINNYLKPVNALYLTQKTTDGRYFSDWLPAHSYSWDGFLRGIMIDHKVPSRFPQIPWPNTLYGQLFALDKQRWQKVE